MGGKPRPKRKTDPGSLGADAGPEAIDRVFGTLDRLFSSVINEGDWYYHRALVDADDPPRSRKEKRGNLLHKKGCQCPACNRGPRSRRRKTTGNFSSQQKGKS